MAYKVLENLYLIFIKESFIWCVLHERQRAKQ